MRSADAGSPAISATGRGGDKLPAVGSRAGERQQRHEPRPLDRPAQVALFRRIGTGALALHDIEGESPAERGIRGATAATGLVYRLLLIWAVIISAMTLYGWSL